MNRRFLPFTAAIALSLVAGCNSYDPTLGATPFRCGTSDPRCPSGYTCTQVSGTDELCLSDSMADGGLPGSRADGGNVNCSSDMSIEPNNDTSRATRATFSVGNPTFSLVSLAICSTDADYFRFDTNPGGFSNIRVEISFSVANGNLLLELLNDSGAVITAGSVDPGNANKQFAEIANAPGSQTFYARVTGATAGVQNNYSIDITVQGTSLR